MSRELDARVARDIFQYDVRQHDHWLEFFVTAEAMFAKDSPFRAYGSGVAEGDGFLLPVPRYSGDMNAAMEVVEKMRSMGFVLKLQSPNPAGTGSGILYKEWFAIFGKPGGESSPLAGSHADTPAKAIVLAALEAVSQK